MGNVSAESVGPYDSFPLGSMLFTLRFLGEVSDAHEKI